MREVIYRAMLRAPIKISATIFGVAGFVGSVWPEWARILLASGMNAESIRIAAIVALAIAAIYFAALWLLKPPAKTVTTSPEGQAATTAGDGSPAMAAGRDIYNYYNSPFPVSDDGTIVLDGGDAGGRHSPEPSSTGQMNIHPDLPLSGLLIRVYASFRFAIGSIPKGGKARTNFLRAVNLRIADTVKLNRLHVWARLGDRALEPIGEYDWGVGIFDHVRNVLFVPGPYSNGIEYRDLHFNKEEIEAVWPDRPETMIDKGK
ncbi:MAG TPA: hypothetical protein VMG08_05770 [Allosphingosinicella sp.]|nr:hypothetical protein [Allosphingosinicella sp.]